ncbi:uncharacterized protein LOC124818360 [Hydra vulgaris]|uniref:uncharacterized protein LOC124818360 n=1 Tax=Hydra vulgaris TaxID=6087 RepID=UPI001F5F3DDF|nr:uncharacterized protein LOC124818360 [Hydra vulgaris]
MAAMLTFWTLFLKKWLISYLPTPSKLPALTDFKCIQKLKNKYPQWKESYNTLHKTPYPPPTVKTWRDDYKLLARLCIAFRRYLDNNILPKMQLPTKLPSSHSARWNIRAIYVLLGYFLIPEERPLLKEIAKFISCSWSLAWFKMREEPNWENLKETTSSCIKAQEALTRHIHDVKILFKNLHRTNKVAEKGLRALDIRCCRAKSNDALERLFFNRNVYANFE